MSALELRDVVKEYRSVGETVRALDEVSLVVASGEFAALYGPSGSGKTTLLLLAAGLLEPDSGEVLFDAQNIARLERRERSLFRRREIGFVFQSFHLIPGATALENAAVKLLADGYSLAEAKQRTRPWLERVGIAERERHRSEQLSMGERQRVAIARALVNEPRLLLTDEPTGNLDAKRSREILALLREICHERAIPALLVTHDPQAANFVDRVYTLRDGDLHDGLDLELNTISG
ncbi:MAG TPA: ABC transporter ATP-binding protein [Solirubrobacteraceae bacterium]|jgi:putative ABC transport system ATP-binding protein|nr:ABC transporter ATP-binding protein [Solirubrobacteraceae bacterium]